MKRIPFSIFVKLAVGMFLMMVWTGAQVFDSWSDLRLRTSYFDQLRSRPNTHPWEVMQVERMVMRDRRVFVMWTSITLGLAAAGALFVTRARRVPLG